MRRESDLSMRQQRLQDSESQYLEEIGHLNRAARRTEKGRRLVAEAKLRQAERELKILKDTK